MTHLFYVLFWNCASICIFSNLIGNSRTMVTRLWTATLIKQSPSTFIYGRQECCYYMIFIVVKQCLFYPGIPMYCWGSFGTLKKCYPGPGDFPAWHVTLFSLAWWTRAQASGLQTTWLKKSETCPGQASQIWELQGQAGITFIKRIMVFTT